MSVVQLRFRCKPVSTLYHRKKYNIIFDVWNFSHLLHFASSTSILSKTKLTYYHYYITNSHLNLKNPELVHSSANEMKLELCKANEMHFKNESTSSATFEALTWRFKHASNVSSVSDAICICLTVIATKLEFDFEKNNKFW